MPQTSPAIRRICLIVFCLTVALTLGQGLVRYRHVLGATGQEFVKLNEADAMVHMILAQRLMDGYGFTNPPTDYHGHLVENEPAFEKAPGYPFFLAALFRVTGIGFSFFPIQCLIGGLLSVLVVLVSAQTFGDPVAALIAGLGAALHPILVNSASQLYNENIYFCLFFLCLWLFLRWHRNPSLGLALLCGCCAGVTALVRESILAPFAALVLLAVISGWKSNRIESLKSAVAMLAGLALIVLPWTIRNYVVSHEVVPISAISMFLIGAGNNECVAADGWGTPFYGDDPCPPLVTQRAEVMASLHQEEGDLTMSRAQATVGWRYVFGHPGEYLKLCVRRAWTVFDPWHAKQHLAGGKKWVMLLYFLMFVVTGLVGAIWAAGRKVNFQAQALYVLLLVSYAPLVVIFVSHDHRFAVGLHVLLACFAGVWLANFHGARGLFPATWQIRTKVD